jgi:hypothetical protein
MSKIAIEPFDWQYKLNQLSTALEKKVTNVEVTGLSFGDELANREMRLMTLAYDNDNDILEILFDRSNHLIESIEIYDDNDNKNIILFNDPFSLYNHD